MFPNYKAIYILTRAIFSDWRFWIYIKNAMNWWRGLKNFKSRVTYIKNRKMFKNKRNYVLLLSSVLSFSLSRSRVPNWPPNADTEEGREKREEKKVKREEIRDKREDFNLRRSPMRAFGFSLRWSLRGYIGPRESHQRNSPIQNLSRWFKTENPSRYRSVRGSSL